MKNILTGQKDCHILDELFAENYNPLNGKFDLSAKSGSGKLYSKVKYLKNSGADITLNDELSDKTVYKIACELALAIDNNSTDEVKKIKVQYGNTKEFAKAKEFLNKECKQVWDVCENKTKKLKVPQNAMKTLGITNKPTLDFFLANSIKYFEKDGGKTTAKILSSVLNNPNLDYTFDDILEYLRANFNKKRSRYNFETIKFLAEQSDYNLYRVSAITSDRDLMKKIFKSLSPVQKVKVIFSTLVQVAEECKFL